MIDGQGRFVAQVAAVFAFGREDIIPDMFRELLPRSGVPCPAKLTEVEKKISVFRYYLERHIELDGKDHGPLAIRLVEQLNGQVGKRTFLTSFHIQFCRARATGRSQLQQLTWLCRDVTICGQGWPLTAGPLLKREDFQLEGRN